MNCFWEAGAVAASEAIGRIRHGFRLIRQNFIAREGGFGITED